MPLRVLSDQQCQFDLRHPREQLVEPQLRAFGTRRIIAARTPAGITESDRNNREAGFVVEHGIVDPEPLAQALAACVVPRDARRMHPRAGRLTDDQNTGVDRRTHDRTRAERKLVSAKSTGTYFAQELVERGIGQDIHRHTYDGRWFAAVKSRRVVYL